MAQSAPSGPTVAVMQSDWAYLIQISNTENAGSYGSLWIYRRKDERNSSLFLFLLCSSINLPSLLNFFDAIKLRNFLASCLLYSKDRLLIESPDKRVRNMGRKRAVRNIVQPLIQ